MVVSLVFIGLSSVINGSAAGKIQPLVMIIFFDWASNGMTGTADHVGIVARVENNRVYTIECNTSDSCLESSYSLGDYEILGYGMLLF